MTTAIRASRTFAALCAASLVTLTLGCTQSTPQPVPSIAPITEPTERAGLVTDSVTPLEEIAGTNLKLKTPGVLTVATLANTAVKNEDGSLFFSGIENSLLNAMAEKLGLGVEYQVEDFPRIIPKLQNHTYDLATASMVITPERQEKVNFTNPIGCGVQITVTRKDSTLTGLSEAPPETTVGVLRDSVQDKFITDTFEKEPVRFDNINAGLNALLSGEIDMWIGGKAYEAALSATDGQLKVVDQGFNCNDYIAFAVTPDSEPLLEALNSALDAVIEDGTWLKLKEEWAGTLPVPSTFHPGSNSVKMPTQ